MFEPMRWSRDVRRDAVRMLRALDAADTLAAAEALGDVTMPVLIAGLPTIGSSRPSTRRAWRRR